MIYYGWQKKDYWSWAEIAGKRRTLAANRGVGYPHTGKLCKIIKKTTKSLVILSFLDRASS
jgi:hypothetical protein